MSSEEAALHAAIAAATQPTLGGALHARLCWLLSCWWAFGGRGDAEEDARLCAAPAANLASTGHHPHARPDGVPTATLTP